MADKTTVENPQSQPNPAVDQKALADAITQGLSTALPNAIKPLIERVSESNRPQPVHQEQPQMIVAPTADQIAEATISGNKAELARLLTLQSAANAQQRERELGVIRSQGGAALGAAAKQLALTNLKHYKRYQAEIDKEISTIEAQGIIPTFEHYSIAENIVKGRHIDELLNENFEERVRQQREADDAALQPGNSRALSGNQTQEEHEPASLEEAFPGWKEEFRAKARAVGGRSDDEELRKMGFKGGLPEVLKKRKELAAIQEELGDSFGLDKDWDPEKGQWVN